MHRRGAQAVQKLYDQHKDDRALTPEEDAASVSSSLVSSDDDFESEEDEEEEDEEEARAPVPAMIAGRTDFA